MMNKNIVFWVSVLAASMCLNLYECQTDSKSKNSSGDVAVPECGCTGHLKWVTFEWTSPFNATVSVTFKDHKNSSEPKVCKTCGSKLSETDVCTNCSMKTGDTKNSSEPKVCKMCGSELSEPGVCTNCSKKMGDNKNSSEPKVCKMCGSKLSGTGVCMNCTMKVGDKKNASEPIACKMCGSKLSGTGVCSKCGKKIVDNPPVILPIIGRPNATTVTIGDIIFLELGRGKRDPHDMAVLHFNSTQAKIKSEIMNTSCSFYRHKKINWNFGPLRIVEGAHESGILCVNGSEKTPRLAKFFSESDCSISVYGICAVPSLPSPEKIYTECSLTLFGHCVIPSLKKTLKFAW
eukprot:133004_1